MNYENTDNPRVATWRIVRFAVVTGLLVLTGSIGTCAWVRPNYRVWQQEKEGQAEKARADMNRQIRVVEAQAAHEAAKSLAAAEVERARGVAESNKIIGDSLKENESYLRWLWIEGLKTNQMQVIYIPTEAGLPILEAGKAPQR
jgi:regulator of protease activity HflC (stomatin/prohibitin superfamily)